MRRWAPLIRPQGTVLDVACGSGRHLRWLHAQGFAVSGIDRDTAALQALHTVGRVVVADIEDGAWPLPGEVFDGVVVTNYLWRPLLPTIVGLSGGFYFGTAALLGAAQLVLAVQFAQHRSRERARRLFYASLVYLPVLWGLLVVDRA